MRTPRSPAETPSTVAVDSSAVSTFSEHAAESAQLSRALQYYRGSLDAAAKRTDILM